MGSRILDPRPARKLTSRECSKALGGLVGAFATSSWVGPEETRAAVQAIHSNWSELEALRKKVVQEVPFSELADEARALQGENGDVVEKLVHRALGGLASGLRAMASSKAVEAAFRFWAETDEAWSPFR